MIYNVVIVDDEKPQQERLIQLLKKQPEFQIAKVCSSVQEGVEYLSANTPHLVFLDVVMPPSDGFKMLEQLPVINFEIIFTTSYEKFAVQAFKAAAVDYLLKPFSDEDFEIALDKFRDKVNAKKESENLRVLLNNLKEDSGNERIALPVLQGYVFVKMSDIIRCEADNTYTTFHLINQKKIIVSRTLKECEQILEEKGFVRIHNSHLINLNYISEYIRGEGGQVRMEDDSIVDVSRRKKDDLLRRMNKL